MVFPGRQQWRRFFREWVKPIAIVVLVACTFRSAIADWNDVPTGSMKPTILEGDRILVNKLAYDLKVPFTLWHLLEWGDPQRGDIVVFFSPDEHVRMVKRVVGVPGDALELRENVLYVNGKPAIYDLQEGELSTPMIGPNGQEQVILDETVGTTAHTIMLTPGYGARRSFDSIVVPAGRYFLMGDNRDNSRDSRWFGLVSRDLIVGRSSHIALSLDPARRFLPRWNRFLRPMQ